MKIRISRARSYHGGQFYILKDGTKISPDGGWCVSGFLEMFGYAFQFMEGQGVDIEVNHLSNGCSWNIIQGITDNYGPDSVKKEIEYPVWVRMKTLYKGTLIIFVDKNHGVPIYVPDKYRKAYPVGKLRRLSNLEKDNQCWEILSSAQKVGLRNVLFSISQKFNDKQ